MEALAELRRTTGAARCLDCGKCTSSCPLADLGSFSPRAIVREVLEVLEGTPDGQVEAVQLCLTCGACEERCPEGVLFDEFVRGVRELTPPGARAPCPHAGVFRAIARSMTGPRVPERDMAWLGDDLETAEEGEVALFVGCLPFFDIYFGEDLGLRTTEIARAAVRVLNGSGIIPVVLPEERCCGHDLLWGGDHDAFAALAEANATAFRERGIKRIVTACAECCRTWRLDYPEAVPGYRPRVEHLAEHLAGRVEAGEVAFHRNGLRTLTYQDPCRLGRHLGVVDAPRRVLQALPGLELVEMGRSGRDAVCCGTSGFIHCDAASRRLQSTRLDAARATGADTLVTACPKCLIHFSCAQDETRRRGISKPSITVQDFSVLAASMLEEAGETAEKVPAALGGPGGGAP